jgi:DNA replication protein DnaC
VARRSRRPSTHDPRQELVDLALDLDLTALAAALPDILGRAERENLSFTDFSLALLRVESVARRDRSLQRILKRSRLGVVEGLAGFDYSIRPQLDPRVIKELLTCHFIEEHRNVLCLGRPSTGKTRVIKTIGRAACSLGYTVLYVLFADMLETLHASRADGTFARTLRRFVKPQLLVIDEWAYEPVGLDATKDLFRLVSARHRQGSIVLAANTGFSRWAKLFPTEAAAVATVDRLVDDATILRFTGKPGRQPREIVGAPLDEGE